MNKLKAILDIYWGWFKSIVLHPSGLDLESIRQRLCAVMLILMGCVFFLSILLMMNRYQAYQQAQHALAQMHLLREMTSLANKIAKERAPSNQAMSSTIKDLPNNLFCLRRYRAEVNQQMASTIDCLNQQGMQQIAQNLAQQLWPTLVQGRHAVDQYIQAGATEKTAQQLDATIQKMLVTSDQMHMLLAQLMQQSAVQQSKIFPDYHRILWLSDLRDQVGRIGSNMVAALTFQEKMSDVNLAQSRQRQYQVYALWRLISTFQPQQFQATEYLALVDQVSVELMQSAIPMLMHLMPQSHQDQNFSLTASTLTAVLVAKFSSIVQLQHYLIAQSISLLKQQQTQAFESFIWVSSVALIALLSAIFSLMYLHIHIFSPLIQARKMLLTLAYTEEKQCQVQQTQRSLFQAINTLQQHLQQQDRLQLQLQQMAKTDALTGLANRLALQQYLAHLQQQPKKLLASALMMIDIDDLKKINDAAGHMLGDRVIQWVAKQLTLNLRAGDLLVRYGGDEFLMILEQIQLHQVEQLAEKIRNTILAQTGSFMQQEESFVISVSIGVACAACTWTDLLQCADQALLQAKMQGKNKIVRLTASSL